MPKEKGPARSVGPIPYYLAVLTGDSSWSRIQAGVGLPEILHLHLEIVVAVGFDADVAGVLIVDELGRRHEVGRDVGDERCRVTVGAVKPVRQPCHSHPISALRRPDIVETDDEPERSGRVRRHFEVCRRVGTRSRTGRRHPEGCDTPCVRDASAGLDREPEPMLERRGRTTCGLLLEPEVAAIGAQGELDCEIGPLFVATDRRLGACVHECESRATRWTPRAGGAILEPVVENGCDGDRRRGDENDCENCGEQQALELHGSFLLGNELRRL